MTLFLLGSDTVIGVLKGIPRAVKLVDELFLQKDTLGTCLVVVAEVYAGVTPIDEMRASSLLSAMEDLDAPSEVGRQAGVWRYEFARQRVQLSAPDCLIAATAHYLHATLNTGTTRHFPMPELATLRLSRD